MPPVMVSAWAARRAGAGHVLAPTHGRRRPACSTSALRAACHGRRAAAIARWPSDRGTGRRLRAGGKDNHPPCWRTPERHPRRQRRADLAHHYRRHHGRRERVALVRRSRYGRARLPGLSVARITSAAPMTIERYSWSQPTVATSALVRAQARPSLAPESPSGPRPPHTPPLPARAPSLAPHPHLPPPPPLPRCGALSNVASERLPVLHIRLNLPQN